MKFEFLQGEEGEQSSKRLFTFILVVLFTVYFFSNLYWGKVLHESLADNLFYLIGFMYGGVLFEKMIPYLFKNKDKVNDKV